MRTSLAPLLFGLLIAACSGEPGQPAGYDPPTPKSTDWSRQLRELYDSAKEKSEAVPPDIFEWARDDVQRIGDWEYLVVSLPEDDDDGALATALNELGKERWEVFWIDGQAGGFRAFLKRPTRSYLRVIPLAELRRLVPGWGGGE